MQAKRLLALALSATITVGCTGFTPAFAANDTPPAGVVTGLEKEDNKPATDFSKFKDVGNHWARSSLQWAVKNGIVAGTSSTTITPNGPVTRAQLAMMVTRAFGATKEADISMYVDVAKDAWYYGAIAKAVQMGCFSGFGNAANPNENVNRQEVAVMLVKAAGYPLTNTGNLNRFKDASLVDSWAAPYLSTAIANGIMAGYDNGNCGPKDPVTRAQFVTMLQRVATAYMTPTATFTEKTVNGSLMVGVGNISLDNMTINGNVFLSDGVGTGDITFNGTKVTGSVFVRGTGPDTVKLTNGSTATSVVLTNPNNAVRLVVDDSSQVRTTYVHDANGGVTLSGDVGAVVVETGKAPVKFLEATADDITVQGKFAELSIDSKSSVGNIKIQSSAEAATISLDGKAKTLDIGAKDVTVSVKGSLDELSYSTAGSKSKITLDKECEIDELNMNTDDLETDLVGHFSVVNITGDDCDIGFGSGTVIDNLYIEGNNNIVELASGAKVKKVYIDGDDITLTGKADVTKIQVDGGKDIAVSIPGADLYNKGGKNVTVGDLTISRGDTVTISSSGTSTEEYDKEQSQNNNNNNSNNNNNNNSGNNSGNNNQGGGSSTTPTPTPTPTPDPDAPAIDSTINNFSVPTGAAPSDFGMNNAYSIDSFGSGFNVATEFPADGKEVTILNGTVAYIENFAAFGSSGYFYPLVLNTSYVDENNVSIEVDGKTFGNELVSKGSKMPGSIILYVPIQPSNISRVVEIEFDADGPNGKQYNPVSAQVRGGTIMFSGGNAHVEVYEGTSAAPGLDGAETATVGTVSATDNSDHIAVSMYLSTKALLETKDTAGRFGYWVGIRVPAPADAESATMELTYPDSTTNKVHSLFVQGASDTEQGYVEFYMDAKNKGTGNGKYTAEISWVGKDDKPVSTTAKVIYTVDVTGCVLAGEGQTETPGQQEAAPIVTDLTISIPEDAEISSYGKVSDYLINGKVAGHAVSGFLFAADAGKPSPVEEGKFYLPLKIAGTFAGAATLVTDTKAALGTIDGAGEKSVIAMVPVDGRGSAFDFRIEVSGTGFKDVKQVIDMSNVDTGTANIGFEAAPNTGNIQNKPLTDWVTDYSVEAGSSYLDVYGTVKKVSASEAGIAGADATNGWFYPVTLQANVKAADGWKMVIKSYSNSFSIQLEPSHFQEGKATVLLPAALGDEQYPFLQVTIESDTGEELAYASIYASNLTLEGFTPPPAGGDTEGTPYRCSET